MNPQDFFAALKARLGELAPEAERGVRTAIDTAVNAPILPFSPDVTARNLFTRPAGTLKTQPFPLQQPISIDPGSEYAAFKQNPRDSMMATVMGMATPVEPIAPKNAAVTQIAGSLMGNKAAAVGADIMPEAQAVVKQIAKRIKPEDVIETKPVINLKRDVPIKDIHGNKATIPAGEALTPYELKGGKVLLKDGEEYIVNKNQYQNVKGNAMTGEAKPFAPELDQTQETVRGMPTEEEARAYLLNDEQLMSGSTPTKYSQYTLPGGENYREILIQAPEDLKLTPQEIEFKQLNGKTFRGDGVLTVGERERLEELRPLVQEGLIDKVNSKSYFKGSHWDEPNVISHIRMNDRQLPSGEKVAFIEELQSDWAREARGLASPDELYKKAVSNGMSPDQARKDIDFLLDNPMDTPERPTGESWKRLSDANTGIDLNAIFHDRKPTHPLLKNWQELSIKRALKDAVDSGADYLAWTNGEQQAARYNLSKQVDKIKWEPYEGNSAGEKFITIVPTGNNNALQVHVKSDGEIFAGDGVPSDWMGKNLSEAIGKGISEKILKGDNGTLSGEGLNIGGEWAKRLYDEQVPNIVKDLTGAKPEPLDMGLPVGKSETPWGIAGKGEITKPEQMKPGQVILRGDRGDRFTDQAQDQWVVTKVNPDGSFRAVQDLVADNEADVYKTILSGHEDTHGDTPSITEVGLDPREIKFLDKYAETFNLGTTASQQMGIRITPEIRAKVLGQAPPLKQPSGASPFEEAKQAAVKQIAGSVAL